ncbi:hypothetical protein HAX54_022481 [Datura stramonium]|uniref:Uncharacterized protein n=1 Tax=Datura stramonium TaxID=4076 RepID=A0ABS8UW87_DATST|nr:hypothetical protein [Datura stramonium]
MLHSDDPEEMLKNMLCKVHLVWRSPATSQPCIHVQAQFVKGLLHSHDENAPDEEASAMPKNFFQILNQIIEALSIVPVPELALKLYLECAEDSKAQYSAKLLKKPDQCRAVYACSHLFWVDDQDNIKDGERVLLCLKRALRIVTLLNKMSNATREQWIVVLLFYRNSAKPTFIPVLLPLINRSLQSLIELITTEMQSENTTADPAADALFASTPYPVPEG